MASKGQILHYCPTCEEMAWKTTDNGEGFARGCSLCGNECEEVFYCYFCLKTYEGTQCFARGNLTACKACDFREECAKDGCSCEDKCELANGQEKINEMVKIFSDLDEQAQLVDEAPYAHNLVSLHLQTIEERTNKPFVNKVIEDFDLEELGWSKVETEDELAGEMLDFYEAVRGKNLVRPIAEMWERIQSLISKGLNDEQITTWLERNRPDVLHHREFYHCVLCEEPFIGFGNNPQPLADNGRCCNECNGDVIAARISAADK